MKDEQNPFFFDTPVRFLQEWVQLVVPSLTALFARAVLHFEGHLLPLVRSNLGNHAQKLLVLLVIPGSLLRLLFVHLGVAIYDWLLLGLRLLRLLRFLLKNQISID